MELSLVPRANAAAASPVLFSPLKPFSPLLRFPPRSPGRGQRFRFRAVAAAAGEEVFGGRRELTGVQPLVEAMPPLARAAVELAVAAAAAAAGYGVGLRVGGTRTTAVVGAAALGAVSLAGAAALNSVAPEVAAVGLHNYVAGHDDPAELGNGEVEAIASKYGVSTQDAAFKAELLGLYASFVSSVIPPGDEELKGTEAEAIIKFKAALGLDDADAANVHLEIGRSLRRDMEQWRPFQKLIYVSNLVFGDASESLLPWNRLLGVTDAQIAVAIRENAKSLYSSQLESIGRGLDIGSLIEARRAQLWYKLPDEDAAEMFREHARKLIQEDLASAFEAVNSSSPTEAIEKVEAILAFNNSLTLLSKFPDGDRFAYGLGPIPLGGEFLELYAGFIKSILPPGDEDLKGDEADAIIQFKTTLGLDDADAANVHMEIGRSLRGDMEQWRPFQKLIYVSYLVFGDASADLLPWQRLGVTDSQIEVAIQENAKSLYAVQLESIGRGIDIGTLIEARRAQLAYKLSDEIAAEMFRDHTNNLIQHNITSALEAVDSSPEQVVAQVESILSFNNMLTVLSKFPAGDRLARGLGPISLGGDHDWRDDVLKMLYRAYAKQVLSDGRLDHAKLADLNQLRDVFGLTTRESDGIISDVISQTYATAGAK